MSSVAVTVVLVVRNPGEDLDSCIENVVAQRDVSLELVVVDDGSIDSTPDRLDAWTVRDPRVRVIRRSRDGLTAGLLAGCLAARGAWIARQDASGRSEPSRLARQLEAFRLHSDLALVSCFTETVAPGGEILYLDRGSAEPDRAVSMFDAGSPRHHVGPTAHGSTMFPRRLYEEVGGYRTEFALGQDWDLWLRLGEHGTYLTVGEVLHRRRLDLDSTSFAHRDLQMAFGELSTRASDLRRAGLAEEPALEKARALSERYHLRRDRPRKRRTRALGLYHVGETLRRRADPGAENYLRDAIRADPLLLRAWLRLAQTRLTGRLGSERGG